MMQYKTYFNWSTGKDSAMALYTLLNDEQYSIAHLLTVVNAFHDRVSMHGLRRSLFEQQVLSLNIPYSTIELPENPDMPTYETAMKDAVARMRTLGLDHAAFGDIFLEDLRRYREQQLDQEGITAHFPLWKKNTTLLLREFIDLGFKAIVVCVQADVLDRSFAGRLLDHSFLDDLPAGVDPCGENGEYHTFCFDGPIFSKPVLFSKGEVVYREYHAATVNARGFWYCDLVPAGPEVSLI